MTQTRDANKRDMPRWMRIGFAVMVVASLGGLATIITRIVRKISAGQGLDTYRTVWLVEFNHVGLLVLLLAAVVALAIGGVLRFREHAEWGNPEKEYRLKINLAQERAEQSRRN